MGKKPQLSRENIMGIVSQYKEGKTIKEICEVTGLQTRSVQRWVKRFRDSGKACIPIPKPRSGRPRITTSRTLKSIKSQVDKNPELSAREVKEGNPRLLRGVSLRTVQRRLCQDIGYRRCKLLRKPLVTHGQQVKRVAFAKKYSDWDLQKWRQVLWSDETVFTVTGTRSGRVYRRPGSDQVDQKFIESTVKHPDSLMVWGCFSYHGVGDLVVLPKNEMMNQRDYFELLCDYLPDSFEKCSASIFMQDCVPCHTAKSIKQWLKDCCVDFIEDWPGNSPDINPIENLWPLIKRDLKRKDTSSIPKLEACIREIWTNFDESELRNLADSLPIRLQQVIKNKGRPIKYYKKGAEMKLKAKLAAVPEPEPLPKPGLEEKVEEGADMLEAILPNVKDEISDMENSIAAEMKSEVDSEDLLEVKEEPIDVKTKLPDDENGDEKLPAEAYETKKSRINPDKIQFKSNNNLDKNLDAYEDRKLNVVFIECMKEIDVKSDHDSQELMLSSIVRPKCCDSRTWRDWP